MKYPHAQKCARMRKTYAPALFTALASKPMPRQRETDLATRSNNRKRLRRSVCVAKSECASHVTSHSPSKQPRGLLCWPFLRLPPTKRTFFFLAFLRFFFFGFFFAWAGSHHDSSARKRDQY